MNRPRVLLADDHRLVAEGLKSLLVDEFDLVAIVEDGLTLLAAAKDLEPDVILLDITMPGLNGLNALPRLKKEVPKAKVVVLTMHQDAAYARRALAAGALGYVVKHAAPDELIMAIHSALSNKVFISPSITQDVLRTVANGPSAAVDPMNSLTPRQREIVQLVAEGLSAKQIASALGISTRTAEFHKYQAMEALGLHTSADLVRFAVKHGLVDG